MTTPLRQRMIDDMKVRNMSALTRAAYVRAVKNFAAFHRKRPAHYPHSGWRLTAVQHNKVSATAIAREAAPSIGILPSQKP